MLKSIVCTYPDFRTLPKGLKQMLVASENIFFNEVTGPAPQSASRDVNSDRFWQPSADRYQARGLGVGIVE
jgi:hypothetical protein